VADQMAIMNHDGAIEQIGTPKEIYEFPVSSFVAKFVGTTNIIKGILQVREHGLALEVKNLGLFDVFAPEKKSWMVHGKEVFMSLRPEKILITKRTVDNFSNQLVGIVESIVYHGRSTQYNVRLKNDHLICIFEQNEEHFPREEIDYGNQVNIYWQKENALLLER
jgi:spermidine/putrescine transport system ATP-binding protein